MRETASLRRGIPETGTWSKLYSNCSTLKCLSNTDNGRHVYTWEHHPHGAWRYAVVWNWKCARCVMWNILRVDGALGDIQQLPFRFDRKTERTFSFSLIREGLSLAYNKNSRAVTLFKTKQSLRFSFDFEFCYVHAFLQKMKRGSHNITYALLWEVLPVIAIFSCLRFR